MIDEDGDLKQGLIEVPKADPRPEFNPKTDLFKPDSVVQGKIPE
jgi:hypothetical protein